MPADLAYRVPRDPGALIRHGDHHSEEREIGIGTAADLLQGVEEVVGALERVVRRRQRQQQEVARHHCVHRDEPQRRRSVDHDVVELLPNVLEAIPKAVVGVDVAHELALQLRERNARLGYRKAFHRRGADDLREADLAGERLQHRGAGWIRIDDTHRGVRLGVDIHKQRPVSGAGERRRQVDRRGGLGYSALLVRNGDGGAHRLPFSACHRGRPRPGLPASRRAPRCPPVVRRPPP